MAHVARSCAGADAFMASNSIRSHIVRSVSIAASAVLGLLISAGPTRAEMQISIYSGSNFASPSDVHLTGPNGTNATFNSVGWTTNPFSFVGDDKDAPYYGARLTYWFDSMPNWGVRIDYTHAKLYAKLDSTVGASGTVNGKPLPPNVELNSVFSHLQFTDGINMLTFDVAYRYPLGNKFTPYVSAGIGPAIPSVEVTQPGLAATHDYQVTGIVARTFIGMQYEIYKGWSVFGEYGISYAQINNGHLVSGGNISTDVWDQHLNFGISYAFSLF
jgi:lipid A oxidase